MERERHSEHRRSDRDRDRDSSRRSRRDDSGRSRDKGRKRSRSRSQERRHARDDSRTEDSRHAKSSRHDHEKASSTRDRHDSKHREKESSHRKRDREDASDRHEKPASTVRSVSKDPDEYDPMDPDGLGSTYNAEPDAAEVEFDAGVTPEEIAMMAAMGIPFGFDTTNGKEVADDRANAGAVKAKQTRQARQYMNRRGGFNRPLPAEKTGEKVNLQ